MEKSILNLFLYSNKLKFNEIEKQLQTRSNKLSYHLKSLCKKGILSKDNETYSLTETSEYLIPYLSQKQVPLPVLLIHIGNNKKAFLHQRKKRPFKDKLSLPGGRIIQGESLPLAVQRIMKEKFNIQAKLTKIHSLSIEHVKKNNKIIHSFLLILVSAKSHQPIELTPLEKNKSKIISSDFNLLKNNLNKKIDINYLITKN